MKIEHKNTNLTNIENLKSGQVFLSHNSIYMVVDKEYKDDEEALIAVSIVSGVAVPLSSFKEVELLPNATLVY